MVHRNITLRLYLFIRSLPIHLRMKLVLATILREFSKTWPAALIFYSCYVLLTQNTIPILICMPLHPSSHPTTCIQNEGMCKYMHTLLHVKKKRNRHMHSVTLYMHAWEAPFHTYALTNIRDHAHNSPPGNHLSSGEEFTVMLSVLQAQT